MPSREAQAQPKPTPQERIEAAEADTIEALRDIFRAEARSAAAEASMTENLVEVQKATGNAVMSIFEQGPLPHGSPAGWLVNLAKGFGKEFAVDLAKEALGWVKDPLSGGADKQNGRSGQTLAAAIKELIAKGKPQVPQQPTPPSTPGKTPTFSGLGVNPPPSPPPK
jgi:hypothetical protein